MCGPLNYWVDWALILELSDQKGDNRGRKKHPWALLSWSRSAIYTILCMSQMLKRRRRPHRHSSQVKNWVRSSLDYQYDNHIYSAVLPHPHTQREQWRRQRKLFIAARLPWLKVLCIPGPASSASTQVAVTMRLITERAGWTVQRQVWKKPSSGINLPSQQIFTFLIPVAGKLSNHLIASKGAQNCRGRHDSWIWWHGNSI